MLSVNFCLPFPWSMGHLPQDTTLKKMRFISQQLPIDKNISITGGTLCHPSPLNTYTLYNAGILCSLSMCCFCTLFCKDCEFRYLHKALIPSSHLPLWFLNFLCIFFPKEPWNLGEMIHHRCSVGDEHFLSFCTLIGVGFFTDAIYCKRSIFDECWEMHDSMGVQHKELV